MAHHVTLRENDYSILRRPRRKTLSIVIRADNKIDVLAPSRIPIALIHQFVQDKQAWIYKKLQHNQRIKSIHPAKTFSNGEYFHVLGNDYRLTILHSATCVHLCDDQLIVSSQHDIKQQLSAWYQQQAEQYIQQRSQYFSSIIGKQPASIGIKAYKSRWGTCHHDGRIYINWRLIMAPAWVMDYVIVHELCHLIHHNHSKAFWHAVERVMPDYNNANTWLKNNGRSLDLS